MDASDEDGDLWTDRRSIDEADPAGHTTTVATSLDKDVNKLAVQLAAARPIAAQIRANHLETIAAQQPIE